jgi:uncharacterized membrane protein
MKTIIEKLKRPAVAWSLIITASFVFYVVGISHESLWCDEAFSAMMVKYNLAGILANTVKDVHPPLYYIIIKIFSLILGRSEWALRLVSVLGATGLVALGAGPVRKLFGARTAYVYAAAALVTPVILIMAHEARMYSLAMFTVTASAVYGLLILKEGKPSSWIIFGVSVLASAYLHYYALLAVFVINIFMLVWILVKKRDQLKFFLITAALVVAAYAPWIFFFLGQVSKVDRAFWINPAQPFTVFLSVLHYFTYKNFFPKGIVTDVFGPVVLGVIFITIIVALVFMLKNKEKQKSGMLLLLTTGCLGTLLFAFLVSLFVAPILYHRYMAVCAGLLILAFSVAAGHFRRNAVTASLVALFVALNATAIFNIQVRRFNGPFYDITDKIGAKIKPGDLVITTDCYCVSPALYYLPQADHFFYVNRFEKDWEFTFDALRSNFTPVKDAKEIQEKYGSFWIIQNTVGFSVDEQTIIPNIPEWRRVEREYFTYPYSEIGFTVSKYVFPSPNSGNKGSSR